VTVTALTHGCTLAATSDTTLVQRSARKAFVDKAFSMGEARLDEAV
jgi:hypothetical protein